MYRRLFSVKSLQKLSSGGGTGRAIFLSILTAGVVIGCFTLQAKLGPYLFQRTFFLWFLVNFGVSAFWGLIPGIVGVVLSTVASGLTYGPDGRLAPLNPFEVYPVACVALMGIIFLVGNQRKTRMSQQLAFELLDKEKRQIQLEQLSVITDCSNDLIVLSDSIGRIVYLNRRILSFLGLKIFDPQTSNLFLGDIFEPVLPGSVTIDAITPVELSNKNIIAGNLKPVTDFRIIPVRFSQIEVPGRTKVERLHAFIFYDQSLEVELHRRISIAKGHLPMAFWSYSFATSHYEPSLEHDQILGRAYPEWSFERLLECVDPRDRSIVSGWLDSLKTSNVPPDFDLVYRVNTETDEVRWVHSVGIIFRDIKGNPSRIEGVLLDITTIKESEEQLREAVALRDHFFAIASHELKTPIASLNLQIEVLRQTILEGLENSSAVKQNCLEVIDECEEQYRRLTNLVNDFLDVARIANGKLHLTKSTFSVPEWIDSTIKLFAPNANIFVSTPIVPGASELMVRGDKERLRQVLVNLLSNAIKFGLNNPIDVIYSDNSTHISIKVRDRGIGIESNNIQRIFNEFEQLNLANQKRGLGLGLYITREIMRAHGGQIRVESTLGSGSTFEILLPRDLMN